MLNKRQEQLLTILRERGGWMTSRTLAEMLRVTDRTIRSDVEKVNRMIQPPPIESNVRTGYRVVSSQVPAGSVEALGQSMQAAIPQTPGARCIYIIRKLLFECRELSLTELQSQIFVSESSLNNDLKRIRGMIEPYGDLKLVRSGERISLQGDEMSKRRLYRELLVAEVQENFLNLNRLAHLYKNFDLIEVKDIFVKVLEEYDYSINEALLPMLILHAGTSIERMSTCHYIQMEAPQPGLEDTIEYQIVKTLFERISNRLHIGVQEGEISRFALVVMGRRASSYTTDHIKFQDRWLNIRKLVNGALERLNNIFGVDYRADEDLQAGLQMHLYGLIERLNNHVTLEDVFLEEIKQKYPLVFEMGICIVAYLEEQLGVPVTEMESGFIALHLGAASERVNPVRKYQVVLILPHNPAFSDMCEKKLMEMFRERIDVVSTLSYYEEKAVRRLNPDIIMTTFPLEHKLEVPTIQISLFVDAKTESRVLQTLNQLDKKRFHLEFAFHIGNLIRREHYYQNLDCRTPEEVVRCLCKGMEEKGIIDESYCGIVLEREKMSPTSYANALAIPHAFRAYATTSTIAVAQLKNPILWGMFEVRLVMLFAINEGDQRMIKIFFEWISDIIGDPRQMAALTAGCSYDTFVERIMN